MSDFFFRRRKIPKPLPEYLAVKWSPRVLDEGFVPFPKRLLSVVHQIFRGDTGIEELSVVLAVADYRRLAMSRGPSIDFLAFTVGLDVDTFRARLDKLVERELVTRTGPDQAMDIELTGLLRRIEELTPSEPETQVPWGAE